MFYNPLFTVPILLLAIVGAWRLIVKEWMPSMKRIGLIGILLAILGMFLILKTLRANNVLYEIAAFVSLGVLIFNGVKAILGRFDLSPKLQWLND